MTANRIGIDFSQDYFDLILVDGDGRPITSVKRFDHNRLGSQAALDYLIPVCQAHPADQLWIGGESTGLLWWHLYQQWGLDEHLASLNPQFYLLNPSLVKGFRKSAPRQDKTDPKDARLIARYLGIPDQELHAWQPDAPYWALRFLTRSRFRLAHQLSTLKLQAHNSLYLLASAYDQAEPFSNTFGKTSLQILRSYPTLDSLAYLPLDELVLCLEELSHGRLPDPQGNAHKLQTAARRSYPLDPQLVPSVHFILRQLLDLIEQLEKRLKAFDGFITELTADDPDHQHLLGLGGIGPVYSAGLQAEICPTQRFLVDDKFDPATGLHRPRTLAQAQAAVAKMAGLWWPRTQSGDFEAQDRRLPAPATRTCATTWSKLPTMSGNPWLTTANTTSANMPKPKSILTVGRLS